MKEFNKWFKIAFSFMGKDFEESISLKQVHKPAADDERREWDYMFTINVGDDTYDVVVYGTYDDNGDIRTSGECYVNGDEVAPCFGIEVYDSEDELVAEISDIDIIDSE